MRRFFVCLLLLACGFGIATAQELTSGTLEGTVTNEEGAGVEDAVITVMGPQGVQTTTTDGKGRFSMRGLTPGDYQVKAEAAGLTTIVQSGVKIYINRRTQLPFVLSTGVTETITVVSKAPVVDLKSTTTGETIKVGDFAPYLPVGRNLVSMVSIAPGVSDGGTIGAQNTSISGSSGLENAYFVDGVNVTNSGFGALGSYSIVYGSLGTGVTYDFLEEVQVQTGGFEAEFGQAGGGVVNSVVKSGSNKFGFDISWYEEPASLEGSRGDRIDFPNWANREETTRQDISLTAGGPILKDKLFYFAAYNPVTIEEDFKLTSGDGDEAYDLDGDGTADDFFAIGESVVGGRVPSTVTREREIDNYAGKVSWFLVPNHKIELTAFGDPSDGKVGPQDPVTFMRNLADPIGVPDPSAGAVGLDYGGDQLSFKYQGIWTSNFFTEVLYANKENNFTETGPGTTFRRFFDEVANAATGGTGFYEDKSDEVDQWAIKNTHVFGPVEVRYGFQYDDMEFADPSFRSGPPYTAYIPVIDDVPVNVDLDGNGMMDDFGIGFINDGCAGGAGDLNDPLCYSAITSSTGASVSIDSLGQYNVTRTAFEPLDSVTTNEETNWFAQVSWDVVPNVTIKAGVRWTEQELQGSGTFSLPLGVTDDSHSATGALTTDYTPKTYKFDSELAPRFGVSWDVMNNGKHKLYGNYGEYYQRVPSDLAVRQFSNEVGIEGELFEDADLADPVLSAGACWTDANNDGTYDTQVSCHIVEGLTGAEPGVILDGTIDPSGDPDEGPNSATKLPYTKEWLLGYAWEVNDYTSFEARYISRELGRVLEDVQFASNEQIWNQFRGGTLFPNYGGEVFADHGVGSFGAYVLANPGDNVNPTLFPAPVRDYDAWEFVYNRRFHDSWMAYLNYRYADLEGNYEGSYRNDNGQSDPFITSLFDIPAYSYNEDTDEFVESETLKGQYVIGPLNTDRTHIFNAFLSKQFDMGLNLGGRVTVRSGQPQFPLFAHPTYRNSGEIPGVDPEYWWLVDVDNDVLNDATAALNGCDPLTDSWCEDGIPDNDPMGRGVIVDEDANLNIFPDQDLDGDGTDDRVLGRAAGSSGLSRLFSYDAVARDHFGRNPTTVTFDLHASYDVDLRDGQSKLTFLLDIFNLFNDNDALTFDTALETSPGVINPDYLKSNLYQAPRNMRLGAKFTW